jgi:hypothetical protein
MRETHKVRRDSLPMTIIRHMEQQGLGWGHNLYPDQFWIKNDKNKRGR